MVIKNKCGKIIGFSMVNVLPGQTGEIEDDFKNNDVLKAYVNLGYVEIVNGDNRAEEVEKEVAPKKVNKGKKTAVAAEQAE